MRHTQANTPLSHRAEPSSRAADLHRSLASLSAPCSLFMSSAQHVHCSAVEGEGEEMSEAVLSRSCCVMSGRGIGQELNTRMKETDAHWLLQMKMSEEWVVQRTER